MKNPFKSTGFDSLIGKGVTVTGSIDVIGTMLIDGGVNGGNLTGTSGTVHLAGNADVTSIEVKNLTVCGSLRADTIKVTGTLAIQKGAILDAKTVTYGILVIEPGANLTCALSPISVDTSST